MTRLTISATLLSLVLAACAGGSDAPVLEKAQTTAQEPHDPASGPTAHLIWGANREDGSLWTLWVERERDGAVRVVDVMEPVVAVAGELWMLSIERSPVRLTVDCGLEWGDEPMGTETGTVTALRLQPVTGERAPIELLAPGSAHDMADHEESIHLLGSVGRYLFAERSVYGFACGAHGNVTNEGYIFDLETGRPVELVDGDSVNRRFADRALAALRARDDMVLFSETASFTRTRPDYAATGLRMMHQLTADTCYACSDGNWSSYTVSTEIADDRLPAQMQPKNSDVGPLVRELATSHSWFEIRGIQSVDPALAEDFEALTITGC